MCGDLNEELGLTRKEWHFRWASTPYFLNKDEASRTYLTIRNAFSSGKKSVIVELVDSAECVLLQWYREYTENGFFHFTVIPLLLKTVDGHIDHMIYERRFVLEASFVCSNVVALLNKNEECVLLRLLDIMRIVVWKSEKKFLYGESLSLFLLTIWSTLIFCIKLRSKVGGRECLGFTIVLGEGG